MRNAIKSTKHSSVPKRTDLRNFSTNLKEAIPLSVRVVTSLIHGMYPRFSLLFILPEIADTKPAHR